MSPGHRGARAPVIGEVLRVRLSDVVPVVPGTLFAGTTALRPVGRLWGDLYATTARCRRSGGRNDRDVAR